MRKNDYNQQTVDAALLVRDIACEEAVLGSMLSDRNAYADYQERFTDETFYAPKHREIYQCIKAIAERGDEVSILSVMPELLKRSSEVSAYELTQISGKGVIFGLGQHVARLKDLETKRRMWMLGQKMVLCGTSEAEEFETVLSEVRVGLDNISSDTTQHISTLKDALYSLNTLVNDNLNPEKRNNGTLTGFDMIDAKGGLQGSDLVIIAGATSQGKTSFVMSMTRNAIAFGKRVAFYSMEMTKIQLTARLVAIESKVPSTKLLYSPLSDTQIKAMDEGMGKLLTASDNLYFDDRSTSNIDTIIASIRSMKIKHNIDGAVIDYLQILNVNMKNTNKEQAMGDVARRLKNLAKELGIWIIALSQLNRDNQSKEPSIDRLRDSGQIAEAADIVMLVYRPEYYGTKFPSPFDCVNTSGKAMIDICKGRNIGVGKFICGFDKETTHFYQTTEMDIERTNNKNTNVEMPF